MNKLRYHPAAKAVLWLLLFVLSAGAFFCTAWAVPTLPYFQAKTLEDSQPFQSLLLARQRDVAAYLTARAQLERGDLDYATRQQLKQKADALADSLSPDKTYFRCRVCSRDGTREYYSNLRSDESLEDTSRVYYASITPSDAMGADGEDWSLSYFGSAGGYSLFRSASRSDTDGAAAAILPEDESERLLLCGVLSDAPRSDDDEFTALARRAEMLERTAKPKLMGAGLCLLAAMGCLLAILWSAGYGKQEEAPRPGWMDRLFLEPLAICLLLAEAGLGVVVLCGCGQLVQWETEQAPMLTYLLPVAAVCALAGAAALGSGALLLRTLVVRVRTGTLGHSILVCRLWRGLCRRSGQAVRVLPFTWRTILAFLCYFFLNLLLFLLTDQQGGVFAALAWLALNIAVLVFLCRWAISFRQLCQGAEAIAQGDLDYQIDVQRMPGDLRTHAQALNNIAAGLSGALEEKMKSERFKAELITNVSHDLKTPLTSIINYVDLLKTTQQTDPNAQAYIEVLDRKSQRLKKLTEDLVEASKASTGVLRVEREKIGLAQLLDQALGEWTEKLESRRLTVVSSVPDGETWVYADGRHLWRVIDNLLSNCAKYAMEGTRVYLDLTRGKGQVSLSVKNISREPLNIPPERLMERFVRGEESRSTEGSGLGLSIARSLTELQGGTFALSVDGDLFKATVTLPQG